MTEHVFALNPDTFDIRRRSKFGCIDCKAAKVRCDQVRPSCGTCARRRRVCRGYTHAKPPPKITRQKTKSYNESSSDGFILLPDSGSDGRAEKTLSIPSPAPDGDAASSFKTAAATTTTTPPGCSAYNARTFFDIIPQSLPVIPPGAIPESDFPTINVYFNRHPNELVISAEFVDEMNASILLLLQDNPTAIGDALYSIGRMYLTEDGRGSLLPMALDRRARTIARLRVKNPSCELEQMLAMTLALGAMEVQFAHHRLHLQQQHAD